MTRERKRATQRDAEIAAYAAETGRLMKGINKKLELAHRMDDFKPETVTATKAPRPHRELESHLEAYFRDKVRRAGGSVHKLVPVEAGIPDRMVLMPGGRIHLVELKIPSGRLSAIQKVWHAKAAQKGTIVDVVWGRDGADKWMEERS